MPTQAEIVKVKDALAAVEQAYADSPVTQEYLAAKASGQAPPKSQEASHARLRFLLDLAQQNVEQFVSGPPISFEAAMAALKQHAEHMIERGRPRSRRSAVPAKPESKSTSARPASKPKSAKPKSKPPALKASDILTVSTPRYPGKQVLAKRRGGELTAETFANRKQANEAAQEFIAVGIRAYVLAKHPFLVWIADAAPQSMPVQAKTSKREPKFQSGALVTSEAHGIPKVGSTGSPPVMLRVDDTTALHVLTQLEGPSWLKRQEKDKLRLMDPRSFWSNAAAYRVLQQTRASLGDAAKGFIVSDILPGAGFIEGMKGELYSVLPDGQIALVAETASPEKRQLAAQHMLVG